VRRHPRDHVLFDNYTTQCVNAGAAGLDSRSCNRNYLGENHLVGMEGRFEGVNYDPCKYMCVRTDVRCWVLGYW
jgi:hypothetical protein